MRSQVHLVAYDIVSAARRARVSRYLAARGERVQKSVFVCRLTAAGSRRLRQALERLIDPSEDRLMIEPMAGRACNTPGPLIL
jgi:CRISPR-associated protein Cas2